MEGGSSLPHQKLPHKLWPFRVWVLNRKGWRLFATHFIVPSILSIIFLSKLVNVIGNSQFLLVKLISFKHKILIVSYTKRYRVGWLTVIVTQTDTEMAG